MKTFKDVKVGDFLPYYLSPNDITFVEVVRTYYDPDYKRVFITVKIDEKEVGYISYNYFKCGYLYSDIGEIIQEREQALEFHKLKIKEIENFLYKIKEM
jgi:hypothetical protein